jgi:nitrite reductase (NADH) small subunit
MDSKLNVKLANVSDIPNGKSAVIKGPHGMDIALFNFNGKIYALENACPHMGGPLAEGQLEDCMVTCPWHGWQFDIRTGICENMPEDNAKTIQIEIINDEVFLKN